MKVLIYGSRGWIGKQMLELLSNYNIEVIEGIARVENVDSLEREIQDVNPTHVMSFIGRTHGRIGDKEFKTIDYLEQKENSLKMFVIIYFRQLYYVYYLKI